jgi:phage protein D
MTKVRKGDRPILPAFSIAIGGKTLEAVTASQVLAVTVDDDIGLPRMCSFDLAGSDGGKAVPPWVDEELFAIGASIVVKLGAPGDLHIVFEGEITALEPDFGLDHLPNLTVRGYDRLHRLQRGRRTRTFTQQKDSDAAAHIAGEASLKSRTRDSGITHEYLVQANQSDFEFLSQRAARIGYELRAEGESLVFEPVRNASSASLTLAFANGLVLFRPRLSAAGQVDEVSVRRWSVKAKEQVPGRAGAGDESSTMDGKETGADLARGKWRAATEHVTAFATASQAEADQFARARFNDRALDFITGEGACWGSPRLLAGTVVQISDIGQRFSGPYYVSRASHRYSQDGYITEFSVRRNAS